MINIFAILITIIVGPCAFWLISHKIYKNSTLKKFPVGETDKWGDTIFLPIFNGVAFANTFSFSYIGLILGVILTISFIYWRKNIVSHDDWSRPSKGVFNMGGWYHATFMFIQASIIFTSTLENYSNIFLWIPLLGYTTMLFIRIKKVKKNAILNL